MEGCSLLSQGLGGFYLEEQPLHLPLLAGFPEKEVSSGGVGASSSFPPHPPALATAPGPSSPLLVSFWDFSGTAAMTRSSRCSGLEEEVAFACGFGSSKAFRGKCPRRRSSVMACSVMRIYG